MSVWRAFGGRLASFTQLATGHARSLQWSARAVATSGTFESLDRVMQLADQCPRGAAGDAVRRAACELVEADTTRQRRAGRRRMLKALAQLDRWQAHQARRQNESDAATLKPLTDALRHAI